MQSVELLSECVTCAPCMCIVLVIVLVIFYVGSDNKVCLVFWISRLLSHSEIVFYLLFIHSICLACWVEGAIKILLHPIIVRHKFTDQKNDLWDHYSLYVGALAWLLPWLFDQRLGLPQRNVKETVSTQNVGSWVRFKNNLVKQRRSISCC